MKTKFKDFLLYSLACVGAVSLFLSAYQPQQTTSTVPESHVWEFYLSNPNTAGKQQAFSLNKVTGEVRKYETQNTFIRKFDYFGAYNVAPKVN